MRDADLSHVDESFMRRALELATRGIGRVSPNPAVGAVIARGTVALGEGFHARAGTSHAEPLAIQDARDKGHADLSDATLYVTLEPCCHHGKTPPCTDAIIDAGIRRVVFAMEDPDPRVRGKGKDTLLSRGVRVESGLLSRDSESLNRPYLKRQATGLPLVTLKFASSLDGKTACHTGASRWISGEASRRDAHALRARSSAILCGIGTVLADDPELTVRDGSGATPARVVVDSSLRIPLSSRLVSSARELPLIVIHATEDQGRERRLIESGVRLIRAPNSNGKVDAEAALRALAASGLDGILVEGGGTLFASLLERGLVDRVVAYVAPILLGGASSPTPFSGLGFEDPARAPRLVNVEITRLGDDAKIEGDLCSRG